jgi:hypothetical protein
MNVRQGGLDQPGEGDTIESQLNALKEELALIGRAIKSLEAGDEVDVEAVMRHSTDLLNDVEKTITARVEQARRKGSLPRSPNSTVKRLQ